MESLITGCILARDEEKNIEDCIKSLKQLTNDIVVLDNGSTDKTSYIALINGCKIIYQNIGNEATLRNQLKSAATGQWIYMMDADERITLDLCDEIKESISKCSENIAAFRVSAHNYYGYGKWSIQIVCRLFRNNDLFEYEGDGVHPSIGNSIIKNGYSIGFIKSSLHHIDALIKDRNISKRSIYINKMINAIKNDSTNNRYRLKNYLAVEYTALKNMT